MNGDFKLLYIKGSSNKRNLFVEYLINIGVNVEVVKHTKEIRGMKADYIVVDEWVEDNTNEH
jgi:hypothetical protein